MDKTIKVSLEVLEVQIDAKFGKVKRMFMHGWMSKPAWVRATGWFVAGAFVALALSGSY